MQIGIVTTPFIRVESHFNLMAHSMLSLLGMRTVHKLDLIAVVNGYRIEGPELQFINSGFDHVEINDRNNLARAWNKGIRLAFERGAEYVLVMNLDINFHPQFLDNLIAFAERRKDAIIWSGMEWKDEKTLETAPLKNTEDSENASFSCFLIDKRLFEKVGEFDEQFEPAYHEDSDMIYRIRLARESHARTASALYWHFEAGTIQGFAAEDQHPLLQEMRVFLDIGMERYGRKWGGLPGKEKYSTPYNT